MEAKRKGSIAINEVAYWIIGGLVLVLVVGIIILLVTRGSSYITYAKSFANSFGG